MEDIKRLLVGFLALGVPMGVLFGLVVLADRGILFPAYIILGAGLLFMFWVVGSLLRE